jgi:hypothetical protein
MKIKIVIGVVAILVLMIGAPSVYTDSKCPPEGCDLPHAKGPQADYRAGYAHGVADAKAGCTDRCHWYILEPGKGFGFHTQEFNNGYVAAICAAGIASDADEATWNCPS